MLIWSFLPNAYLCKTQTLTVLLSLRMELWPLIENQYFPSKLALYLANDILHQSLVQMSVSTTTSLFNHKTPPNCFKLNLNFSLSQIIAL